MVVLNFVKDAFPQMEEQLLSASIVRRVIYFEFRTKFASSINIVLKVRYSMDMDVSTVKTKFLIVMIAGLMELNFTATHATMSSKNREINVNLNPVLEIAQIPALTVCKL